MKRFIPIFMMLLLLTGCGAQSSETSYRQISMEEAVTMMEEETGYIILDVRTAQEYSEKHIPGAINIANESIGTEDIPELLDKDQLILVYCRSGNRSKQASEKLVKLGYRLLGAQIVGYKGVDKRIDVLATAIRAGMKATELKDLDLAYAPPYSSAKDPVNMAGFMVENIANGILKQWHLEDADRLPRDGSVTLLDTRTVEEFAHGHIDGFFNIPVDELRERLDELDKNKPVYVICQSGLRSYIACRILAGNGFDCYNFSGGFRFYDAVTNDRCLIESATACGMDK